MIVSQVKERGGRFLGIENESSMDESTDERLFEISDSAARLKVAQVRSI